MHVEIVNCAISRIADVVHENMVTVDLRRRELGLIGVPVALVRRVQAKYEQRVCREQQ